jgi:hypothetical protein
MDKLQLKGQNLSRVFNFSFGHLHAAHFWCYRVKLPNLKLKTWPKQLLGSLPLVIALPKLKLKTFVDSFFQMFLSHLFLGNWAALD